MYIGKSSQISNKEQVKKQLDIWSLFIVLKLRILRERFIMSIILWVLVY